MMNQTRQTWSDVAHLYRRAGFGAGPDQLDAAASAGYQATGRTGPSGGLGPAPDPDGTASPRRRPPPPRRGRAGARAAEVRAETGALQRWWAQPDARDLHPAPREADPLLARPLRHRRRARCATPG